MSDPDAFRPPPEGSPPSEAPPLPGQHRGGFSRELTEPLQVTHAEQPDPPLPEVAEPDPLSPVPLWTMGGIALTLAIVSLVSSMVMGWLVLVGVAGAVCALISLRRRHESRAVAIWALSLSLLSIAYSVGWLVWVAQRLGML